MVRKSFQFNHRLSHKAKSWVLQGPICGKGGNSSVATDGHGTGEGRAGSGLEMLDIQPVYGLDTHI